MAERLYTVVGTGAIGGYYGACLQKAGQQVNFLLRSDYEYVKQHGLAIESLRGNFTLPQVAAYRDVTDIPPADVVIVALKTTQNHLLPKLLPPLLKPDGVVLLLQNGLGMEEFVASIVGSDRVIGGLCFICAHKTKPGQIHHLDYGSLKMAHYRPHYERVPITDKLCQIAADFEGEVEVDLSEDLLLSRWEKLVWNIPFNGLSVVLNATTEQMMVSKAARSLIQEIMEEVLLGAKSSARAIPDSIIPTLLHMTEQMKPYRTSMKLDYDAGRSPEIEAIFGQPLKMASAAGVLLPRIAMLYQQLKFLVIIKVRKLPQ